MTSVNRWAGIGILAAAVFAGGCAGKRPEDGAVVARYDSYIGPLILLLGIGLFVLMLRTSVRLGKPSRMIWGSIALAVALVVALVPIVDEARVDDEHFETRSAFGWERAPCDVKFDQVQSMQIREEPRKGRRHFNYYLRCTMKDGRVQEFYLGYLLGTLFPEIVERSRRKGLVIEGAECVVP